MTVTTTRTPRGDVILRRNECTNPTIVGQTGWQNLWFGAGGTGVDSMQGTELDKKWTNTPTSMEDSGWRYHHTGFAGDYVQKTASCYFWPGGFEPKSAIKARYYNKDGGLIRYDTGPVTQLYLGNTQGWQRVVGTFQCPPGTAWTDLDFVLMPGNNAQVNQTLAIQRVLIEPGATAYSYFDGDTYASGNGTQSTKWAGTKYASTSELHDYDPASLVTPDLVLGWDQSGTGETAIVHRLLSGAVQVVTRAGTPRSGTLRLFFTDRVKALSCAAQHRTAGVWHYLDTDLPETELWYAVTGPVRAYNSDARTTWTVEVPYTETA